MKKNSIYLLIAIIAAALAAAWLTALPKQEQSGGGAVKKLEDIHPMDHKDLVAAAQASADATSAIKAREEGIQSEFRKCFKKETSAQSLEAVKSTLLQQKEYSAPSVTEESYNLETSDKKSLIVQHIPMEDNSNKVRVFELSPADGLPDRIKDFPQHAAEVSLRLKGALSMGTVQSKTVSTTQSSYDGSMLTLDETNGKVVRVHLITTGFDFECKDQSCLCLKKE